jgi:hypothetical protein
VPSCTQLGGRGQFSHAFGGEVYDFYSVSPEYFGCTLVTLQRYNGNSKAHPITGHEGPEGE